MKIKRSVWAAIIAQAQRELPNEACGYLAEADGVVSAHYELVNTDASNEHFSMDPKEQFAAVKDMRAKGLKQAAVYHSHPETPARPSEEDKRLAYDPNISYVIVSLAAEQPDVKSFRIRGQEVEPELIEILED
ncbi:MAG: M67 family metallopeptidase [bacterium]|nr:M67 family metallopeptidase [bacterium]